MAHETMSHHAGVGDASASPARKSPCLPSAATKLWEVREIDLIRMGVISCTDNEILMLVVDKASTFPFALSLLSKQAEEMARDILHLCLTSVVPKVIRWNRGKEFDASVIQNLFRWFKAGIQL